MLVLESDVEGFRSTNKLTSLSKQSSGFPWKDFRNRGQELITPWRKPITGVAGVAVVTIVTDDHDDQFLKLHIYCTYVHTEYFDSFETDCSCSAWSFILHLMRIITSSRWSSGGVVVE